MRKKIKKKRINSLVERKKHPYKKKVLIKKN